MRKSIYTYAMLLAMPVIALMTSCEARQLTPEDVFIVDEAKLAEVLAAENPEGYKIYNLNSLKSAPFMTENGNFMSDSSLYRTRSAYGSLQLFSIDTLPVNGPGIYIRARVATDDYGGNFYKSLVLQQTQDWENGGALAEPQGLRISVDMGSVSGLYHQGQEIIIRCNGLAIGRYANQPQLCVPSYNNNIFASSAEQKTGWAPGRIPAARFRRATRMLGNPDVSKLVWKVYTLSELKSTYLDNFNDVEGARQSDATLIQLTGVHFTGEYDDYGSVAKCNHYSGADTATVGNPELDKNACTFGPTTENVGYPQSRYVSDGTNRALVSTSEYARYAYYYLPAEKYIGSVTGVLSYYMDNGKYDPDGGEWSITPCSMDEILPEAQQHSDPAQRWVPKEWKKGVAQPEE